MTASPTTMTTNPTEAPTTPCYPQGPCDSGYMDKTNGNYAHWACGDGCPGQVDAGLWGGGYTDYGCGCACIPNDTCSPTAAPTPMPTCSPIPDALSISYGDNIQNVSISYDNGVTFSQIGYEDDWTIGLTLLITNISPNTILRYYVDDVAHTGGFLGVIEYDGMRYEITEPLNSSNWEIISSTDGNIQDLVYTRDGDGPHKRYLYSSDIDADTLWVWNTNGANDILFQFDFGNIIPMTCNPTSDPTSNPTTQQPSVSPTPSPTRCDNLHVQSNAESYSFADRTQNISISYDNGNTFTQLRYQTSYHNQEILDLTDVTQYTILRFHAEAPPTRNGGFLGVIYYDGVRHEITEPLNQSNWEVVSSTDGNTDGLIYIRDDASSWTRAHAYQHVEDDTLWLWNTGTGNSMVFQFNFGNLIPITCNPTSDPTTDPSIDPTQDPTTDPTIDPTSDPTKDPTADPTRDPTRDPTSDPTNDPTNDPTIDPTKDPTTDPTLDPTADPTIDPTNDPTSDPTKDPTMIPTIDPTNEPTMEPTYDPSKYPTMEPTTDPTVDPTFDPTHDPTTAYPSLPPSHSPTSLTSAPSIQGQGQINEDVDKQNFTVTITGTNNLNPDDIDQVIIQTLSITTDDILERTPTDTGVTYKVSANEDLDEGDVEEMISDGLNTRFPDANIEVSVTEGDIDEPAEGEESGATFDLSGITSSYIMIIVIIALVCCIMVLLILLCCKKRKKQKKEMQQDLNVINATINTPKGINTTDADTNTHTADGELEPGIGPRTEMIRVTTEPNSPSTMDGTQSPHSAQSLVNVNLMQPIGIPNNYGYGLGGNIGWTGTLPPEQTAHLHQYQNNGAYNMNPAGYNDDEKDSTDDEQGLDIIYDQGDGVTKGATNGGDDENLNIPPKQDAMMVPAFPRLPSKNESLYGYEQEETPGLHDHASTPL